ncbi:MAG: hypothetical protein HQL99_03165 [Magnetococcales bacterium]|nr:hypothetical protein [Magnetococcales bacterium]
MTRDATCEFAMEYISELRLGYWPQVSQNGVCKKIELESFCIEALPNIQETIEYIGKHEFASDKWFYPPLEYDITSKRQDGHQPKIQTGRFTLPSTHVIKTKNEPLDKDFLYFIVAVIGILIGMRLLPEGWGHFYKVSIKYGSTSDLNCCSIKDIAYVLNMSERFWKSSSPKIRKTMFGAMHWFLFAESYQHQFEKFGILYTVLDACSNVYKEKYGRNEKNEQNHSRRLIALAGYFSIPKPSWAEIRSDNTSEISRLRNEFIHEAQYAGKPIGFHYSSETNKIYLGLQAFNNRLILGLLGIKCGYIKSSVETNQMHGLSLSE